MYPLIMTIGDDIKMNQQQIREDVEKDREVQIIFGPPLMEVCKKHRRHKKAQNIQPMKLPNGQVIKQDVIRAEDCFKLKCRRGCPVLAMPKALTPEDHADIMMEVYAEFYGISMNMYYYTEIPDDYTCNTERSEN